MHSNDISHVKRLLSLLQAEKIRMETGSQDSLDGSRFVATHQAILPAACCTTHVLLSLQTNRLYSCIRELDLLLQDETQFGYLCFGWAGRQEHACLVHANQGDPLQAVNSRLVLQSLLSCYHVQSELFCSFFTPSLIVQEDPGALVTPPKTSAAGIFTCEDNQGADYVLDVAPEPTKKRNEVVKAGNMTLEELQVRHSLLCSLCIAQLPLYVFLIQDFLFLVMYRLWYV